jgi:deoxycytidine triphosphate deaminase
MFYSNRDIKWAIECGKLIVNPPPEHFEAGYDETSVDLHLDTLEHARVWDIRSYRESVSGRGSHRRAELELGSFDWDVIQADYLVEVPVEPGSETAADELLVFRRSNEIIVRPSGFVLWTTKEEVGTPRFDPASSRPRRDPELICFVNAKSTKARTGILVHFTAPTIHAGWSGHITLEISNLGPFDFVLREDDAIAQLTVATISSAPDIGLRRSRQQTQGQADPGGSARGRQTRKTSRRNRGTAGT